MTSQQKADEMMNFRRGRLAGVAAEREAWRERLLRAYAEVKTNKDRGEMFTLIIEEIKAGK